MGHRYMFVSCIGFPFYSIDLSVSCWEILDCWFNFVAGYLSVQVSYFFLFHFCYVIYFQELIYFFQVLGCWHIIFHNVLLCLYFSSVGCYFSYLICDFIWVLSHHLSFFFFKDFIYVFMWDTERQGYRHGENEPPCREPNVGHDSPGPRDHDLSQSRCSTTEAPRCLAD